MAYNTNLRMITGPVSVRDVQQALGSDSPDVGTLCTVLTIKQWAKYRPIQYGTRYVQILTDSQRATVNWGIKNIPAWYGSGSYISNVVDVWVFSDVTASKLPNGYTAPPADDWWAKQLPTDAYRLADFVCGDDHTKGYFLGAEAPIGGIDQIFNNGGKTNVIYKMNVSGVTAGLTITYSDLSEMNNRSYQNLYFGICIVCGTQNSRTIYIATQDNQVGAIDGTGITLWSMGAVVRFKVDSTSGALYTYMNNATPFYVFPIITSRKNYVENSYIQPTGSAAGVVFIPLQPYESVTLQTFYVEGVILDFYAWRDSALTTSRYIYYSAVIVNNDIDVARNFRYRVTVYDSNGNVLGSVYPSNINFAAGEQKTFSSNIDVSSASNARAAFSALLEVMPQDIVPHHDTSATTSIQNGNPR